MIPNDNAGRMNGADPVEIWTPNRWRAFLSAGKFLILAGLATYLGVRASSFWLPTLIVFACLGGIGAFQVMLQRYEATIVITPDSLRLISRRETRSIGWGSIRMMRWGAFFDSLDLDTTSGSVVVVFNGLGSIGRRNVVKHIIGNAKLHRDPKDRLAFIRSTASDDPPMQTAGHGSSDRQEF